MCMPFSSDHGRLTMKTIGTRCEVNVNEALPKDQGHWMFYVGVGQGLTMLKPTQYAYKIVVEGKQKFKYFIL